MITKHKAPESLADMQRMAKEFASLNASQQWEWILTNRECELTVFLDNDDTFGQFNMDEEGDYLLGFKAYIGDSDGVMALLRSIGIPHEQV